MANFLLSWRIFDVMNSFLLSWHFFHRFLEQNILKTYFWCHWHHGIFLTSWQTLTPWQTFLRHDVFFFCHDVFLTSCSTFFYRPDIFFHHFGNKILWKRVFDINDIMIYFWLHDKILMSWQTFCHHDMCLTSWQTFFANVMTNLLTSWRVFDVIGVFLRIFNVITNFLKYVALIDVMTNVLTPGICLTTWHTFLRPDALFDVMFFTLWQTFCRDDLFLSLFRAQNIMETWYRYYNDIFDVMTCFDVIWRVFDFMANCFPSWRIFYFRSNFSFWHYDKLIDIMTCLWHYDDFFYVTNCLTSWRMLHLLRHDEHFDAMELFDITHFLTYWHTFDLMTNLLTRFLSSWHNFSLFWEQNIAKTCFGCHNELFDVIACFWCYDELFLGSMAYFWYTFWHHNVFFYFISQLLTHFWRHDKPFDAMVNVWMWWCIFDVMNFLTSWRTFWRNDVIKLSWQHKHRHNQIHATISEWWCGQTLCWVGISRVSKSIHTTIISLGVFEIISHHRDIIEMHDSLYKNPLPPPSRMLANKHVLYLYICVTRIHLWLNLHWMLYDVCCTIVPALGTLWLIELSGLLLGGSTNWLNNNFSWL